MRIATNKSKYSYVIGRQQAWLVKIVGALGLISLIGLVWGYYNFLNVSIPIKLLLFIPCLIIVLYHFVSYLLQLLFVGFDTREHEERVAAYWHERPIADILSVTVIIPAAGESVSIVRKTVNKALALDYPKKTVYILDDTKEGIYKRMAATQGCRYAHRPNTGESKKAGNLNYALEHLPASDYFLVLDADFVARREMLREMIPYAKPEVGIIQTPQHFSLSDTVYYKSKVAFGAGLIQKEFYRITQTARDRFGAAICVGTNALYNRQALLQVGGYEGVGGYGPWQHSEDVNTGLKMLNYTRRDGSAYKIKYLPVQLATGTCPEDYYSFYKQQNRWCTGSLQLLFSRKTLLSKTLSPLQKLFYFSNGLYYLYTIALLLTPLQLLTISLVHASYHWSYTFAFLPSFIVANLLTPFVFRREPEPLAAAVTITATAYTFLQALWLLIIRRPLGWEATGQKALSKSQRFTEFKVLVVFYFSIAYLGTLLVVVRQGGFGLRASIILQAIFLYSFITQAIHLYYLLFVASAIRIPRHIKFIARNPLSRTVA
ncbi:MAG TPA: glycosyltransferase [Candidatus Saccharimonadales bacterium]|nr:glycosyltransferase [Candidatus Saccharimonadales bacterium]